MPDPRIVQAMEKYRAAVLRLEAESAGRLIEAYARIFSKLQTELRALEADIAALGDNPTVAQVRQLERFKALLKQSAGEMDKYAAVLENEIEAGRARAIAQALQQSKALVQAALPDLPPAVVAELLGSFNRLDPNAIMNLVGALHEGPLKELLDTFGQKAALKLGQVILEGVALGYNPNKVARAMSDILGGNLTRALTISRTEMLRAYRTANLANYAANSGIVKSWRWSCAKSDRTCLACLALDGREFPVTQGFMEAHPNCRCTPEPVTVTYKDLGFDVAEAGPPRVSGAEWFETLSESEQEKFFSKAAWRAFKDGAVDLDDFIGKRTSQDWGDAYIEKSLLDILGAGAAQFYN